MWVSIRTISRADHKTISITKTMAAAVGTITKTMNNTPHEKSVCIAILAVLWFGILAILLVI
jgi:hypothetical protein